MKNYLGFISAVASDQTGFIIRISIASFSWSLCSLLCRFI